METYLLRCPVYTAACTPLPLRPRQDTCFGREDQAIRLWEVATARSRAADRSHRNRIFGRIRTRREDAIPAAGRQDHQALGL